MTRDICITTIVDLSNGCIDNTSIKSNAFTNRQTAAQSFIPNLYSTLDSLQREQGISLDDREAFIEIEKDISKYEELANENDFDLEACINLLEEFNSCPYFETKIYFQIFETKVI